jgi:hypothetical protein
MHECYGSLSYDGLPSVFQYVLRNENISASNMVWLMKDENTHCMLPKKKKLYL